MVPCVNSPARAGVPSSQRVPAPSAVTPRRGGGTAHWAVCTTARRGDPARRAAARNTRTAPGSLATHPQHEAWGTDKERGRETTREAARGGGARGKFNPDSVPRVRHLPPGD